MGSPYPAALVSCHDGDTCTFDVVLADDSMHRTLGITERLILSMRTAVRFCDINAPELGTPGADDSRDALAAAIMAAHTVEVQVPIQRSRDKYGRLLAWVIADGVNLNDEQVRKGHAQPYGEKCR